MNSIIKFLSEKGIGHYVTIAIFDIKEAQKMEISNF